MFEKAKNVIEKEKKPITSRRMTMAFSNKLSIFNNFNTGKEEKIEKKEEKNVPKKIDMMRYSLKLEESRKNSITIRESKTMNKIDIQKHLNTMKEDELKKNVQEEKPKIPPKKISIEDYLKKLNSSNKKIIVIKRKVPKKINAEEILNKMKEDNKGSKNENPDEDAFENINIRNRSSTVSERLSIIKKIEEDKELLEKEKKLMEEERKKRYEERKRREEEKKKKEEEERKKREEEERIRKEEEEKKRKEEEEERKKREEEERIQREKDLEKYKEEIKKREEEERKKREERQKREEEERIRREEEERIQREEEEKKKREEDEEFKKKGLQKLNKKEEDLTQDEIKRLIEWERYNKTLEDYEAIKFKEPTQNSEGKDISFTFEEKKEISTEPLNNIEVTKEGKIITLSSKQISKITIYKEQTYEEEECIILESQVNSITYGNDNLYCSLNEPNDNILIISLKDYDNKTYLNGHENGVTDITLTSRYMLSADNTGLIVCWEDNEVKKKINDFHNKIDTITVVHEGKQLIAILCFKEKKIRFYDLRYTNLLCLEYIDDILGSGFKNNMLILNENILAVAGTYIYIIDLNSLIVTNRINCAFANDSISNFHSNGYFFVSQALTNLFNNELEKGTLGYYKYNFNNNLIPDRNTLVKLASKSKCHDNFITSIKKIDSETILTGSYDGKIKFWILKKIE